jgi:hypothetical protein
MDQAFHEIKHRFTLPPVLLNFSNNDDPLILSIDASSVDMGEILRQFRSDGSKVNKYASKKLNCTQKKYSTTERKCLSMI